MLAGGPAAEHQKTANIWTVVVLLHLTIIIRTEFKGQKCSQHRFWQTGILQFALEMNNNFCNWISKKLQMFEEKILLSITTF